MALSDGEIEVARSGSADDLSRPERKKSSSQRNGKSVARSQSTKHPKPRASMQRRPSAIDRLRRRFSRQKDPLRFAVLGACEVGKSAMLSRIRANTFPVDYEPTFEDCLPHQMVLRSRFPETVEFLDTSGGAAEEYVSTRQRLAASADIFLLMFSIKQMTSLQFLDRIMDELQEECSHLSPADLGGKCILIGNQAGEENVDEVIAGTDDVEEALHIAPRAVFAEDADQFRKKWGISEYVETSALTSYGVGRLETRLRSTCRRVRSVSQTSASDPEEDAKSKQSFFKRFRTRMRTARVPSPIPSAKESESPSNSLSRTTPISKNDELLRGTLERHSLRETRTTAKEDLSPTARPRSSTFSLSGTLRKSFRRRKNTRTERPKAIDTAEDV